MEKKFLWVGTAILALVIFATAATIFYLRSNRAFNGSVINPPSPAADFTLTNQSGQPVKLSDYRGKYILLFFGYTHCINECPATMAILMKTRLLLGDRAGDVQVLFVATDPAGDTPQAVGEFLARFDPTFMGATGTLAELQPVWASYGVTVEDGGETHSSYVYLIDPAGNLRLTYPYPSTPEQIAADLQLLFRRK
ncbi:MAG TPA: SCO family protein [Anaerolineales bacterium]|nr:SCO family protein [Anaerolineales bacterium]